MTTTDTAAPVGASKPTKPLSKKALAAAEKAEAIAKLREWFPKGSTVYTNVEHVSRSGMLRHISVWGYGRDDAGKIAMDANGEPYCVHPNYSVALALGWSMARDSVKVSGCGMDMCFHLVYNLSHVIHGDGYALKHR